MAIVTAGGMTTSTSLTLLVVPVVYALVDKTRLWVQGPASRSSATIVVEEVTQLEE